MKIFAVSTYPECPSTYRATWAYRELYEGRTAGVPNRYGERPYRPMPLVRNVRVLPSVCFASIDLVVDEKIASVWAQLPNVDLNPCVWTGMLDLPMDEASIMKLVRRFSIFDDSFSPWLERKIVPPTAEIAAIPYFQLLAPRFELIPEKPLDGIQFELPSPPYEKIPPIITSPLIHQKYPILKYTGYYFFSEQACAPVSAAFQDAELYFVKEVEL